MCADTIRTYAHSRCLVSVQALRDNIAVLRSRMGPEAGFGAVVKSNAYGHGLDLVTQAIADCADIFIVHSYDEALRVRALVPQHRILVVGPLHREAIGEAIHQGIELTLTAPDQIGALSTALNGQKKHAIVHIKVETGTHRQGAHRTGVVEIARLAAADGRIEVRGVSTHFADIEDTLDHTFAQDQHRRFMDVISDLEAEGLAVPERHCANSAATVLWPSTHGAFVRSGISLYGLWPSRETRLSVIRDTPQESPPTLKPALEWRGTITEIKDVPQGGFVGYGRTFRCTTDSRIGVVGVGYADGYDRGLSNTAHVLYEGVRLPVRGRVCMNMIMVDLNAADNPQVGDEVVLLGRSGGEEISAETLADWMGTINYEAVSRIHQELPRLAVDNPEAE